MGEPGLVVFLPGDDDPVLVDDRKWPEQQVAGHCQDGDDRTNRQGQNREGGCREDRASAKPAEDGVEFGPEDLHLRTTLRNGPL